MLGLLALTNSNAAVHSATAADVITRLHQVTELPVLLALEGSSTSAVWMRLKGWIGAPYELVLLAPGEPASQIASALESSELTCAIHLRSTRQGWEGKLTGDCGGHVLPLAMALTAAPVVTDGGGSILGTSMTRRHGFRIGYAYTNDERYFVSPHLMVMGYEVSQELIGGEGLDAIFIGNLSASGLNQSKLVPSLNLMVGVEFADALQIGVGSSINWTMPEGEVLHMIAAAGWSVPAGAFEVPLHVGYIPDVNDRDRLIVTTGVTF